MVRFMNQLAEATGGELVRVERGAAFADVCGRMPDRYRRRYLLSFTPRADQSARLAAPGGASAPAPRDRRRPARVRHAVAEAWDAQG